MPAAFGPLVSAGWLLDRLGADPDLLVVDVRCNLMDPAWGRARYLEGHIPGAVFADTDTDLSAPKTGTNGRHPLPSPERLAEVFGRLGIGAGTRVVACDDASAMFAARLWWSLRYLGHRGAAVLDGGLSAWTEAGGSLVPGEVKRAPARFVAQPVAGMAIGVKEVETGLADRRHVLLDAREPERFRGEQEPIDPVAGRIPGARNHLWRGNLGDGGRFLTPGELKERLGPALAGRRGRPVVCYCGSGLTAAHNALALELAGATGVAVYSGSWSEWCADPSRPVGRGPEATAS